jgi:DNA-binding GntR family transcriptional regulator
MTFTAIHTLSLREQVVEQIRTAIIEGRLKPNDHIVEAALTQKMGVSRTPVREALILLEREGLVIASPNRGFFVRAFTPDDVRHIFTMRITLENFAAELVIDRLDESDFRHLNHLIDQQRQEIDQDNFERARSTDMAFHRHLIAASNHPLLARSWGELVAQVAALLHVRYAAQVMDEYQVIEDHRRIVAAYRARDLAAVMQANQEINARVMAECQLALRSQR